MKKKALKQSNNVHQGTKKTKTLRPKLAEGRKYRGEQKQKIQTDQ